ncbi:7SK snRNA methylphosphate capping enzyme [Orchesella cincta]|uniref:RNA methyltransferase n=1 Tax=Orchesella cincta TaxID=48709 RepID=A0A1D2MGK4_ORCCI|nr:7SK snRNA methylphosphate capping enzyme [Orchesella cincta]
MGTKHTTTTQTTLQCLPPTFAKLTLKTFREGQRHWRGDECHRSSVEPPIVLEKGWRLVMSQVREALNPGLLEGDLQSVHHHEPHVQLQETFAEEEDDVFAHRDRIRSSRGDQNKDDGAEGRDDDEEGPTGGGGHDSDPPIENQNPEDGDESFEEAKHFTEEDDEGTEGENGNGGNKRKSQYQRKRKKSIHNSTDVSYVPPYKKNRFRRQVSVLPSKFLLGGNIRDPLNLASLADAKVNAEVNKATPKSSASGLVQAATRIGQVPVFIPKNPDDPLGLGVSTENPDDIISGVRTGKNKKHRSRRRHGRKRTESECSVNTDTFDEDNDEEVGTVLAGGTKPGANRKRSISELAVSFGTSDDEDMEDVKGRLLNQKDSATTSVVRNHEEKPVQPEKEPVVEVKEKEKVKAIIEQTEDCKAPTPVAEVKPGLKQNEEINTNKKKDTQVANEEKLPAIVSEDSIGITPTKDEGKDETVKVVNQKDAEEPQQTGVGVYPCKSSEYVPLSSSYAPSPYIFDTLNPEDAFEVKPFESPSLTNYCCNAMTPSHLMEPFSPPPRPEIPHFQRRMQTIGMGSHGHHPHHRHPQMSLRRAVFQKPFHRRRFRHKSDPIVSPVIPQPGCGGRRNHHHHHHNNHNHRHNKKNGEKQGTLNTSSSSSASNQSVLKKGSVPKGNNNRLNTTARNQNEIKNFRQKDEIYQFGNYKQYYGYRTTADGDDPRLWILKKEWFRGKDVLDIGCNIGHVTLSIARDFEARRVHGIDIDNNLITTARKNIKHYMIHDPSDKTVVFPHSLPMIYGAMQPPSRVGTEPQQFPFNVMFSQENYVMSNDAHLEAVKPEYDVIICLSVTKWIHLNFGDDGLKRVFRRMFRHLRKGGKLILEPQEWNSYYKKRKLTEKINENYKNIKFTPEQFQDFLVNEVGFTFVQRVGTPHHSKGFQRPILVFCKESVGDSPTGEQNRGSSEIILSKMQH